ncbi:hypothetical protein, partial [Halodesulfovibrio sp.]|uniref:hypothetical protein n=1 Tax=Halodesulfovibrio sp. TaxID=1912772 RepID=UPI0025D7B4BD
RRRHPAGTKHAHCGVTSKKPNSYVGGLHCDLGFFLFLALYILGSSGICGDTRYHLHIAVVLGIEPTRSAYCLGLYRVVSSGQYWALE